MATGLSVSLCLSINFSSSSRILTQVWIMLCWSDACLDAVVLLRCMSGRCCFALWMLLPLAGVLCGYVNQSYVFLCVDLQLGHVSVKENQSDGFYLSVDFVIRSWSIHLHHLGWLTFLQIYQHMHCMERLMREVWNLTSGSESCGSWMSMKQSTAWCSHPAEVQRTSFWRSRIHFISTTDCSPVMIMRVKLWIGWWHVRGTKVPRSWMQHSSGHQCGLWHRTSSISFETRRKRRSNKQRVCLSSLFNLDWQVLSIHTNGCLKHKQISGMFCWMHLLLALKIWTLWGCL